MFEFDVDCEDAPATVPEKEYGVQFNPLLPSIRHVHALSSPHQ